MSWTAVYPNFQSIPIPLGRVWSELDRPEREKKKKLGKRVVKWTGKIGRFDEKPEKWTEMRGSLWSED